jgi:outer membrane receptor protein involved in Fe transport
VHRAIGDQLVAAYWLYHAGASYDVSAAATLTARIDNLFDKDPPIAVGSGFGGNGNGGTNPVFFDALGRAYRVGLRATF